MNKFTDEVKFYKHNGKDSYWNLEHEKQQRLCSLLVQTWSSNREDCLDLINADPILKYMEKGNAKAAGEYVFTIIQKFLERQHGGKPSLIESEYDYVPSYHFKEVD